MLATPPATIQASPSSQSPTIHTSGLHPNTNPASPAENIYGVPASPHSNNNTPAENGTPSQFQQIPSKLFVVIIETNTVLQPYIAEISNAFLLPTIARYFIDSQKESQGLVEAALIVFRDYVPYAEYLMKATTFTNEIREFRTWLSQVAGSFGEASNIASKPIVEPLCIATKMCKMREAKEKHVILITNSEPSETSCRSCSQLGDIYAHAQRMAKSGIMLSVVSPRNLDSLQRLFNIAKPDFEVPISTKLSPGLQLCRGISPSTGMNLYIYFLPKAPVSTSVPTQPTSSTGTEIPKTAIPTKSTTNQKPIWEGTLQWTSSSQFQCEIAAFISNIRPETDLSLFSLNEWPSILNVSSAIPLKEIQSYLKNARLLDIQVSQRNPGNAQNENAFKSIVVTLSRASQGMIIQLTTKTIFLFAPSAANADPNKKIALIAAIVPKITVPPRTQNPNPAVTIDHTKTIPAKNTQNTLPVKQVNSPQPQMNFPYAANAQPQVMRTYSGGPNLLPTAPGSTQPFPGTIPYRGNFPPGQQ